MKFLRIKFGAQVAGVDEPRLALSYGLFHSQVILQVEFEEFCEPKGLTATELQQLIKKYGSYVKTAKVIGTSEAFVRQNSKAKGPSSCKQPFPVS